MFCNSRHRGIPMSSFPEILEHEQIMRRSLLVGVALMAVVGCVPKKNATSTVKHDVGKPLNDVEARQWRQLSLEEYKKAIGSNIQSMGPFLPATDAKTVRAQYWLDKIDSMLRAAHPEMKNVPKPEAVVIQSDNVNAFIASIPICMEFSFKGGSGKDVKVVALRRNEMVFEEFKSECLSANMDAKAQKEYLTWWTKDFSGCDLKIEGNAVTAGAGCAKYGEIASAEKIVLFQTSAKVGFLSDIFSKMSEGEFVSVVAHELGHYYKSHVTSAASNYNFFYKMGADNLSSRPKADESLREFGEQVLKVSKERMPTGELDGIDLATRARILSTMDKAIKMNLAQYTVEQEADELALEWMSKIGVDASYAVEGQFVLAEIVGGRSKSTGPIGWISGSECRASYEKGWKNESGEAMMIPVADWDVHHSPCFRAFNMDREIEAHKYPSLTKPLQAPSPAWETFKKPAPTPREM